MRPSRQTWRVRGVPRHFNKKKLADVLQNHVDLQITDTLAKNEVDSQSTGTGLHVLTLVPSLRADQVATVRFRHLPSQLEKLEPDRQLTIDIHLLLEDTKGDTGYDRGPFPTQKLAIDQHFHGITMLFAPSKHDVDVLAISGLGSHPYGSFAHKEDGHMWLSDSLPRDMPTSRIMIYGYDSELQGSKSFSSLIDLASSLHIAISSLLQSSKKPLILIGHSLGGLLIKEALIRIAESDSDSHLMDFMCGAVFFGTPNDGMDIESLIPLVGGQPNQQMLQCLNGLNSQVLVLQNRNFSRVLKQATLKLYCFYETKLSPTAAKDPAGQYKMIGPSRCLVTPASAIKCLSSNALEYSAEISRTHSDLVKFTWHDTEYDKVKHVLVRMHQGYINSRHSKAMQVLSPTVPTVPLSQKPQWAVPFGRNKAFVGRETVLTQLCEMIPPSADEEDCQRIAIEGLGGVGKTQIALEAAFRLHKFHSSCNVFWIPAIDATSFESAYRDIGRRLRIKGIDEDNADVKLLVKIALSQSEENWLLVVDNADDWELLFGSAESPPLCDYLPFNCKGSILFTTRNHEIVVQLDIPGSHCFKIREMSKEEGTSLLYQNLKPHQTDDLESTANLLDFLTNLPLAIKQASAYMARTSMTTTQYFYYCQASDSHLIELLSKDFGDRARYQSCSNPVATTWLISFRHILRDKPIAAEYLKFMSFIAEEDIPKSLLPKCYSELDIHEAIGTLTGYAFITEREDAKSYDMHRLVRRVMQNWLNQEGELEKSTTSVVEQLNETFPFPEHANRDTWVRYLPHAMMALNSCNNSTENATKAQLLFNIAESSYILGKYQNAEEFHREALALRIQALGTKHPKTLTSMNNLALVLGEQRKFEEAEAIQRNELSVRTQLYGAWNPETLTCMNNLAFVLNEQGNHKEAETIHRHALSLKTELYGAKHPKTLTTMSNLAFVLGEQGNDEEAEVMHRNVLSLRTQVLGIAHPATLISTNNAAFMLRKQRKYDEAEAMYREVVSLMTQILSNTHPDTLTSKSNLAKVLSYQGKHKEAEIMLREVLSLRIQVLGATHPGTIDSRDYLAFLLRIQGKLE